MDGKSYVDENGEALELDGEWFAESERGFPTPQTQDSGRSGMLRLDPDVLEYFRGTGKGWKKRINDILRGAMR